MKFACAALAFVFAHFTACAPAPAAPPTPLTEALLAHARAWNDPANSASSARAELARMTDRVRALHQQEPTQSMRALLRRVVFEEGGFAREVDDQSLRYVFLPSVLNARRGSCVGLGTVYLALSERLGLDMHGVLVPGHFYVRLREQGQLHNIELLRQGEELPDGWYRERWPIKTSSRAYARPLSAAEVEAVLLFDIGNDRKRSQNIAQAERAFTQAAARFPDFAEAHASAGSMAHLLGALDRAEAAYAAAHAADPNLSGLSDNIALLRAELPQPR